jgi:hypothetical protein
MSVVNFSYFDIVPGNDNGNYGGVNLNFKYPKTTPKGDGYIDIVNTLPWKNNTAGATYEVPSLLVTEYSIPFGLTVQNIFNFFDAAAGVIGSDKSIDPYSMMYIGEPTKFKYNLPYILKSGSSIRGNTKNSWKRVKGVVEQILGDNNKESGDTMQLIRGVLNTVSENATGFTTGYGVEDIYRYTNTTAKSITITFPLYNTVDEKSTINNLSFVSLFGLQNLKTRTTWLTYTPPKIYKVEGIGVGSLYMPAAYVSSFDVKTIGTLRRISDLGANNSGGILIPEAYDVSITFTELVPESANIMAGSLGEEKVQVIQDNAALQEALLKAPKAPSNQTSPTPGANGSIPFGGFFPLGG